MGLLESALAKLGVGDNSGPKTISDQTTEEQDLVGFCRARLEESRAAASRVSHEGVWMTNIAYVLGYDGVYYDTNSRSFRPADKNYRFQGRNRIHVNKILPTLQNRLARLAKNEPQYDVRPGSPSNDDKEAAKLGLQILTQYWDLERINRKRLDLLMWVQQCGHGYLDVSFDPDKGEPMVDPATGDLVGYEGDISVNVVSPFEVFPDPLAKTLDDAQWVIKAKLRKLDYFKNRYPERGEMVREEGAWLLSAQYESRINGLTTQGFTSGTAEARFKNAAIEVVYYERRSKKHPQGRMVVSANGALLENKELPVGKFPLVKFDDILIAGKYYSESTVTHARPSQDQYNRTIQKRADWVNRLLTGKILAPRGAGLQQESLNDQSGEVVYYDQTPNGGPPTPMAMPNIPSYAYNEDKVHESNINDIMGISEVSKGTLPSASIPAIGMQLLTEQDDTRIGVITEQHEEAYASVGNLVLLNVEKFIKTPRLLKMAGDGMEYTVKQFVGADIRGNHDVTVIRGSTVPGSKVLRRQELLNAYTQGLLGDPQDPQVRSNVLGMLEYGDVAEIWKTRTLQMGMIQKEIRTIEAGGMPRINKLDPHILAIQELNDYRMTDKYDSMDPMRQGNLLATIDLHTQMMMKLQDPSIETEAEHGPPPQSPEEEAANADPNAPPTPAGDRLGKSVAKREAQTSAGAPPPPGAM